MDCVVSCCVHGMIQVYDEYASTATSAVSRCGNCLHGPRCVKSTWMASIGESYSSEGASPRGGVSCRCLRDFARMHVGQCWMNLSTDVLGII